MIITLWGCEGGARVGHQWAQAGQSAIGSRIKMLPIMILRLDGKSIDDVNLQMIKESHLTFQSY